MPAAKRKPQQMADDQILFRYLDTMMDKNADATPAGQKKIADMRTRQQTVLFAQMKRKVAESNVIAPGTWVIHERKLQCGECKRVLRLNHLRYIQYFIANHVLKNEACNAQMIKRQSSHKEFQDLVEKSVSNSSGLLKKMGKPDNKVKQINGHHKNQSKGNKSHIYKRRSGTVLEEIKQRDFESNSQKNVGPALFKCGQEVLVHWRDGFFYVGRIRKVDSRYPSYQLEFQDKTLHWTHQRHILKVPSKDDIICVICHGGESEKPDEIVLCDSCGLGYHQECHNPLIPGEVLKVNVPWKCRGCLFALAPKELLKKRENQIFKSKLPYKLSTLKWDAHHRINRDGVYCYCGGPGQWFSRMLQCNGCQQWFHDACVQSLMKPLLPGDRHFVFKCSLCNKGKEYMARIAYKWKQLLHLAIYNLGLAPDAPRFFDVYEHVVPWVEKHWKSLEVSQKKTQLSDEERKRKIYSVLLTHNDVFVCGKEQRKKNTWFHLRINLPPNPPALDNLDTLDGTALKNLNNLTTAISVVNNGPSASEGSTSAESEEESASRKRKLSSRDDDDSRVDKNANKVDLLCMNAIEASTKRRKILKLDEECSLEDLIPSLPDYEGANNPFRTILECNLMKRERQLKQRLIQSCSEHFPEADHNGSVCSDDSLSSSATGSLKTSKSRASINGDDASSVRDDDSGEVECRNGRIVQKYFPGRDARGFPKMKRMSYIMESAQAFRVVGSRIVDGKQAEFLLKWDSQLLAKNISQFS